MKIHKIHAGRELPSVVGADGHYYDDPGTVADETLDNGKYILNSPATWNSAAFPAVIANCVACHTQAVAGTLAQVDNWKVVPSRAACGSCHDLVDFASGLNHAGGGFANDTLCASCHPATGTVISKSVTEAHDWTKKDIRNISEFDITVTTNTPSRGYYINGESPVISIALKDHFTQAVVVPNTVIEDPALEGCIPVVGSEGTLCTVTRDGLFAAANLYVTGPRAQRTPALTYNARAKVTSATAGPWNLSAAAGSALRVKVDAGVAMIYFDASLTAAGYGADKLASGDITVTRSFTASDNAFFANQAAATPAEVANWLNANAAFKLRAIAYVDEALPGSANAGKLSIRSRGLLGKDLAGNPTHVATNKNILIAGDTLLAAGTMFAANSYGVSSGSVQARIRATANATDPKANFTDNTAIQYTLDPVDDLVPGTYMINVEYNDGGNLSSATGNYRTPSVALATFQVKQAAEEKMIATNCTACHWSDAGVGYILDYPRHHKLFNEHAVDHCGGCHDYTSGENPLTATLTYTPYAAGNFSSGHPISKRVHSIHNGVNLTYPTITVAHEETEAFGRNWRITYPMNIRNCESCHPAGTTSGTWKTNPNRLACMGCHDSDSATAHINAQTYDPTPYAPWNGDELESCAACH